MIQRTGVNGTGRKRGTKCSCKSKLSVKKEDLNAQGSLKNILCQQAEGVGVKFLVQSADGLTRTMAVENQTIAAFDFLTFYWLRKKATLIISLIGTEFHSCS